MAYYSTKKERINKYVEIKFTVAQHIIVQKKIE